MRPASDRSCFRRDLARDQNARLSFQPAPRPYCGQSRAGQPQLQLALRFSHERIFACMAAPARGPLCAPCPGLDLDEVDSSLRPSSAFLRPQLAIVTARAGSLTQARLPRDAPEATAVATELQTRARRLPKRAVCEVRISPGYARGAAVHLASCHVIARSYGHMRQLTAVSRVSQCCTTLRKH